MKTWWYCLLLIMLIAPSVMSYRFVCNGFLANGEERSDGCGVCDAETAARWENPHIAVAIDKAPLPKGISEQDWQQVANMSFAAWEAVPGTSLKFVQINSPNPREFGANEHIHEIFWITDRTEWRKLVGSGEFGTLGATLPRYACDDESDAKRVLFDADLVLNGLPHINWQVDCQDEDCISIQTTLVHELGHFFGLDHPCPLCGNSIMSARAGFDLINPVFDDMEGLRALYPDQKRIGEFGFPCDKDSDCRGKNHCISDGNNNYCSRSCVNDGECEQGSICSDMGASRLCTFADTESAQGRVKGENCMRAPCVEPLICAGAAEPDFYCFMPCQKNSDCLGSEECIKLEDNLSLCVDIKKKGEHCNHRVLCEEHLYCVFENLYQGYCRAPCLSTGTASSGCGPGEQCELMEKRVEICMPTEEHLVLDVPSDEFGQGQGKKIPDQEQTAQNGETTMGCHNLASSANGTMWLVVLMGWLVNSMRKRGNAV